MILPSTLTLGVQLLTAMTVADSVPVLDVEQLCQGIAQQGGVTFHDPSIVKEKRDCLESERATRDQLIRQWGSFAVADRNACTNEARMGGDSSYTELLTCLEMARDVRSMHNGQEDEQRGGKSK
ncbi:MAG TPA: hypothetical protein VGJ20_24185 [Xanthobacteraceae bacterium]